MPPFSYHGPFRIGLPAGSSAQLRNVVLVAFSWAGCGWLLFGVHRAHGGNLGMEDRERSGCLFSCFPIDPTAQYLVCCSGGWRGVAAWVSYLQHEEPCSILHRIPQRIIVSASQIELLICMFHKLPGRSSPRNLLGEPGKDPFPSSGGAGSRSFPHFKSHVVGVTCKITCR
ncbi:hypothetical protein B0T22DRAFT_13857 [Podospora appendiculata]|uniref:Uncharacterized protein n=1 Tax=Podospora appendiculata TaxID=314037 RepID=A0AAE1CFB4_9PEZI|nr:hypothetical protein B0T22DRAFT_13857 [Podospora appendiculata]